MKHLFPILLTVLIALQSFGETSALRIREHLQWNEPILVQTEPQKQYLLNFTAAAYPTGGFLPHFQQTIFFSEKNTAFNSYELTNLRVDSTDLSRYIQPEDLLQLASELVISTDRAVSQGREGILVSFIPLLFEPETGKVFRVIEFELLIHTRQEAHSGAMLKCTYASQSVLATGNWFKFSVQNTGIYRITYNDLVSAGLNPAAINPKNLRLYGNGGGMLPEPNAEARIDDLIENAIVVVGEDDGVFNTQDYVLFFGQSPHQWKYAPGSANFEHLHNIYSDHNYYFLTADLGPGKRVGLQPNASQPANYVVSVFNAYLVHDQNLRNLMKSGRQWYGEEFDAILTRTFNFDFPNRVTDSAFSVRSNFAANSLQSTSFAFNINGTSAQASVPAVHSGFYPPIARDASLARTLVSNQANIEIKLTFNKSAFPSKGWLNYIWVHALRQLRMSGDQMTFRSLASVAPGRVSEFRIGNANAALQLWDVSDPANVGRVDAALQGNELVFKLSSDFLREFIVFDPAKPVSVQFVEKVPNQNLHSASVPDMLIVTHPLFLTEANRLADFHNATSGLEVLVATTPQIYNEFSSGKQDVSAIRDFAKMLYDRDSEPHKFKYLLLFGDASYDLKDYKDRVSVNTNFVPGWMSNESLDPVQSYITDDYYGFLDLSEGGSGTNILDLGIGRLPAGTLAEATAMVNKIIHYSENVELVMGDWRNYICLIADDEDNNTHKRDAEILSKAIDTLFDVFNQSKIYLDAYPQVSVPGGKRYPQVNADINKRVQQGALIVNYIGHGGVLGLAHERVLEIVDIKNWTNYDRLPVFITATCEFAYFDDPTHTSPGELILLNPNGGGIALYTTTRPTYASYNFPLNQRLFENSFKRINGEYPRMGDIMRLSKQNSGNDTNARKFVLLGDPALKMALPTFRVNTTHVNETDLSVLTPILKALSLVTVKGNISDINGSIISDFNGELIPIMFDKAQKIITLANDGGEPYSFMSQQNIIYKGKVSVVAGHFDFSFMVPKDIAYAMGSGKISYYATDGQRDAHGADRRIIIGGFNETAAVDLAGPTIELFMNNEKFKPGGITDQNPILLAKVSDESGINTTGIGIGHDITAILNNQSDKVYLLNDFYQTDLDTYQSGTIRYPFYNLPDGRHSLRLKVWDIYNNASEGFIEFVVASSGAIALREVLNYPNPFRDRTQFVIEHNQAGEIIDYEIYIYSLDGRIRKTMKETIRTGNYRSEIFTWDGRGDNGQMLEGGTYVYRIIMRNAATGTEEKSSKLVIIR